MPQLSIVIPTFNELGNVIELRNRVALAMGDCDWELIFVDDDSPDGTANLVRELAQGDRRVRCVQRIGRRGLVSACLEGFMASSAPLVAVMDGDLQHDEKLLPQMLQALQADEQIDIVAGSRYVEGGGLGDFERSREKISRLATRLGTLVLKADLKDPMSGFFMLRREVAMRCIRAGMSGVGFKILLDLFASSPQPLRFRELPYHFRSRVAGESKLDTNVAWEYMLMLMDRMLGGIVPVRFIAFAFVGGIGLVVHMAVLSLLFGAADAEFTVAQALATLVAMSSNFVLNNMLTYRDMRLRGWAMVRGWVTFTLACSVGALANVGVAGWLYGQQPRYWLVSALAGVLVGTVWNYAATMVYTWKKPRTTA